MTEQPTREQTEAVIAYYDTDVAQSQPKLLTLLAVARAYLASHGDFNAGLEAAAMRLQDWQRPSLLRLHAGEMTAQEKRTIKSVLNGLTFALRAMKKDVP